VQVTYLGYPNTTGLPRKVMQYRITDAVCDPPGTSDKWCTEELVRLASCFLCYGPPAEAPEVVDPPVVTNGNITFGSFNGMPKITRSQISLWAQILKSVPKSKMLIKNKSLADPEIQQLLHAAFAEHGIERDRLTLSASAPSTKEHLARYADMDIGLDTYPYNGTTTTCEALWMGVPVVSLQGNVHRSRVGSSILTAVGRSEWIAQTPEQYLQTAISLAASVEHLSGCRASLRYEMLQSDLTNASKFTRGFEAKLRSLWTRACAQTGG
jgi:protein O-GlcNAc transferase